MNDEDVIKMTARVGSGLVSPVIAEFRGTRESLALILRYRGQTEAHMSKDNKNERSSEIDGRGLSRVGQ